jgi:hypothetical protein
VAQSGVAHPRVNQVIHISKINGYMRGRLNPSFIARFRSFSPLAIVRRVILNPCDDPSLRQIVDDACKVA